MLFAAGSFLSAITATAACGGTSATWRSAAPEPSATPPASSAPPPTVTASPTHPATTSAPPPTRTLEYYLDRIPTFPSPPRPEPVKLTGPQGQAWWGNRIPTDQPVAFITIDDGINRHPWAAELIRAADVPVTLFLTTKYVSGHKGYFAELLDTGNVVIEGHTVSHPNLTKLSYEDQRYQLCHATDQLENWYGRRPVLFRPPYGEKNADTMKAAHSCGLHAGFHWRATVDKGKVRYQASDKKVHPGDILLMHFRPAFPDDFLAALVAIKESGLTPALLEDYIELPDPSA